MFTLLLGSRLSFLGMGGERALGLSWEIPYLDSGPTSSLPTARCGSRGGEGRDMRCVFSQEADVSCLAHHWAFLGAQSWMAAGLQDRLEEKPERHQEVAQLSSCRLIPASRRGRLCSPLPSPQLDPLCTRLVALPLKYQLRWAAGAVLHSQGSVRPAHPFYHGWGWGDRALSPFSTESVFLPIPAPL